MPLAAGTSDGGLNFSNMPLLPPRIMQALNLPLDGGYASRNTAVGTGKAIEEAAAAKAAAAREPRIDSSFDSTRPKAEGTFISFVPQAPSLAHIPRALTRQARSRDTLATKTSWVTAS